MPKPRRGLTVGRMMVIVALCAPIAAGGSWYWRATHRGWTVARVENLIRSEVPPRATRAEVIAWRDRHGLLPYWDGDGQVAAHARAAQMDLSRCQTYEMAIISYPRANADLLTGGQIVTVFLFDGRDQLVGWQVEGWPYD